MGTRQRGRAAGTSASPGRNQKSRRKSRSAIARTIGRGTPRVKTGREAAGAALPPPRHVVVLPPFHGRTSPRAPRRPDVETIAPDGCKRRARIFAGLGVPAATPPGRRLLVRANLRGHDSHGVIRIPQYVGSIRKGRRIRVRTCRSSRNADHGDCRRRSWPGQVVARRAAEVGSTRRRGSARGRRIDGRTTSAGWRTTRSWRPARIRRARLDQRPTAHSVVPYGGLAAASPPTRSQSRFPGRTVTSPSRSTWPPASSPREKSA